MATTTVASALADWRAQTKFLIIAASLSAIIVAVILMLIVRRLSWQHQSSQHRVKLEKQRLDTAVENMTQGLTLFDQSKRLVVCNQRYIEMYGLSPDVVKPGCHLRDLISHRNELGSIQVDIDEYCTRILEHVARARVGHPAIHRKGVRFRSTTGRCPMAGGSPPMKTSPSGRARSTDIFQQATELARINMQFDAALSNMAQGLCMFDGQKRLVVWNERYAELYQIAAGAAENRNASPDAIIADRISRGILKGETSDSAARAEDCFIEPASEGCRIEQGRRICRRTLHPGHPAADG